jgi:MIP family channel proteins
MVSNLGHISGGHFNPAITIGFLVTRRIAAVLAAAYVFAQLLGAVCAAFILRYLFTQFAVKVTAPAPHTTDAKAFVLEMIMTVFLVWAVWATAVDPRGAFKAIAGLAIGLTITIDVFVGGPVTGAAMNPARAFGPELAGNVWSGWWIYWIGPIAGALIASLVYEYLYLRPVQPPVVGTPESGVDEPRPGETAVS